MQQSARRVVYQDTPGLKRRIKREDLIDCLGRTLGQGDGLNWGCMSQEIIEVSLIEQFKPDCPGTSK